MIKHIGLFVLLNTLCASVYCQSDSINRSTLTICDTLNRNAFTQMVKEKIRDIKGKNVFSTNELLEIIKIGMSPALEGGATKKTRNIYKKYTDLYWGKMVQIACADKELGYAPLKGMVCYSLKYDLYITPPLKRSEMPCHNYYVVIE